VLVHVLAHVVPSVHGRIIIEITVSGHFEGLEVKWETKGRIVALSSLSDCRLYRRIDLNFIAFILVYKAQ